MTTDDAEQLPELAVRPGLLDTVMYAAAMWEFQLLHFDHDRAREEGLPGAVVQGPLLGNYLARTIQQGMPTGLELYHLEWRNRAVVPVGEPLRCGGTVGAAEADGFRDVELWIHDGSGVAVVTGAARLGPVRAPASTRA